MGEHSGSKYLRTIHPADGTGEPIRVDVYSVLVAFGVTCPGRQHAIKKLLCAGLRGKNSEAKDVSESIDAVRRAVQLLEQAKPGVTEEQLKVVQTPLGRLCVPDAKSAPKEHVFNSMHEAVLYAGHRKATTDRPFRAVSCGNGWTVEEVTEVTK